MTFRCHQWKKEEAHSDGRKDSHKKTGSHSHGSCENMETVKDPGEKNGVDKYK